MEGFDCDSGGGFDFGGVLDVPGMVTNAITSFLGTLVEQAMKPVREFLADTLLATPDVTRHADIKKLWKTMLGITAGIYLLFVTGGGLTVMGYETVQIRYALQQIAPRLVLGMVAAVTSLTVMGKAIGFSNALAHAILATDTADAGQGAVERVLPFALFGGQGLKVYLVLLAIVVLALVLAVLIGFLVRVAVMALLATCAPLMLACHAHPVTDPVARLWWRGLAGCLVIQVAQSMTFILALKLFFAPGATALGIPKSDQLGTMLAGAALFWVLFKIPGWTLQVVLRGTPVHNPHAPTGLRMLKHLAMYRLMEHYLPTTRLLRRPGGGRGGGGRGGGFGLGRGGPRGGGGRPGAGGGGRPPRPGPGRAAASGGRRGGGRGWLAHGRAALGASATPPAAAASPGTAAGPPSSSVPPRSGTSGAAGAGAMAAPAGGGSPGLRAGPPASQARRGRLHVPPAPRGVPQGPRASAEPVRAGRGRQLALPITTRRTAARPSRPTQMWLPIRAERTPAPRAATAAPAAAVRRLPGPPTARPSLAVRARQLALPVPARRVRVCPPRPMQLRLPLEPPRR